MDLTVLERAQFEKHIDSINSTGVSRVCSSGRESTDYECAVVGATIPKLDLVESLRHSTYWIAFASLLGFVLFQCGIIGLPLAIAPLAAVIPALLLFVFRRWITVRTICRGDKNIQAPASSTTELTRLVMGDKLSLSRFRRSLQEAGLGSLPLIATEVFPIWNFVAAAFLVILGLRSIARGSVLLGCVLIVLAICVAIARLRPKYFRLSPGKLELLVSFWWSTRIASEDEVKLADSRIEIDLGNALVRIFSPRSDGDVELRAVNLARVSQPYDFCALLLLASASDPGKFILPSATLL